MRKMTRLPWLILFAAFLVACQSAGEKIKPGDRIGDMEFISKAKDCRAPNLNQLCTFEDLSIGRCLIPASVDKFWIASGWVEGSPEALELTWKDSVWSLTVDDRQVDLQAFGTSEVSWDTQQAILWDVRDKEAKEIHHSQQRGRKWDVCISNPGIGKHTIRYEFLLKNGLWSGNHVETYSFIVTATAFP